MPNVHDAIVIGGGHNGLVAACYLARAGLDVVVLEAEPTPGGMSHTGPMIPAAPNHLTNTCAVDTLFLRASDIVADLGLARHGFAEIPVDPAQLYLHRDGSSIALWSDPRRTADEIRRFSASDAAAYVDLMNTIVPAIKMALPYFNTHPTRPSPRALARMGGAALRSARLLPRLPRVFLAPAAQTIDERFRHPIVRDFVAGACGSVGPIDEDTSGMLFMLFAFQHYFGAWRIRGGTQRLIDALGGVLAESGGVVRTSAGVEEILVRGGRAVGVRLRSGEELTARRGVLSTCDVRTTLGRLLPAGHLDAATQAAVDYIPSNGTGIGDLRIDIALSGRANLDRWAKWRGEGLDLRVPGHWMSDHASSLVNYQTCRAGRIPADPAIFGAVPTGADPSQAPDGQDVVYLWANPMPLDGGADWEQAVKAVMDKAGEFYGGLDLEIGRWVENSAGRAERLGATNGAIYHTDMSPFRVGPMRPAFGLSGYRTPITGLFLGGAGSHPTPLVAGLPGRLSAATLVRHA